MRACASIAPYLRLLRASDGVSMCASSLVSSLHARSGSSRCVGIALCQQTAEDDSLWNVFWTDTSVNHERVSALGPLQKLNHFVDMTVICRKASAAAVLNSNARHSPHKFEFYPRSWTLPKDAAALTRLMKSADRPVLIFKPNKGSQGAGISICRTLDELEATWQACIYTWQACIYTAPHLALPFSHLSPLTPHLSPPTSHLPPPTSHL